MTESSDMCEVSKFTGPELVMHLGAVVLHVSDALHDSQSRTPGGTGIEARLVWV